MINSTEQEIKGLLDAIDKKNYTINRVMFGSITEEEFKIKGDRCTFNNVEFGVFVGETPVALVKSTGKIRLEKGKETMITDISYEYRADKIFNKDNRLMYALEFNNVFDDVRSRIRKYIVEKSDEEYTILLFKKTFGDALFIVDL